MKCSGLCCAVTMVVLCGGQSGCAPAPVKGAVLTPNVPSPLILRQMPEAAPGNPNDAVQQSADLDREIASALDAGLVQAKLHDSVKYSVEHQVVTLRGKVASQLARARSLEVAGHIPNVELVVSEVHVRSPRSGRSKPQGHR